MKTPFIKRPTTIIVLIVVIAILAFGYYKAKKNNQSVQSSNSQSNIDPNSDIESDPGDEIDAPPASSDQPQSVPDPNNNSGLLAP